MVLGQLRNGLRSEQGGVLSGTLEPGYDLRIELSQKLVDFVDGVHLIIITRIVKDYQYNQYYYPYYLHLVYIQYYYLS